MILLVEIEKRFSPWFFVVVSQFFEHSVASGRSIADILGIYIRAIDLLASMGGRDLLHFGYSQAKLYRIYVFGKKHWAP